MKPTYMEFILCISVLPEDDYKKQSKYVGVVSCMCEKVKFFV